MTFHLCRWFRFGLVCDLVEPAQYAGTERADPTLFHAA